MVECDRAVTQRTISCWVNIFYILLGVLGKSHPKIRKLVDRKNCPLGSQPSTLQSYRHLECVCVCLLGLTVASSSTQSSGKGVRGHQVGRISSNSWPSRIRFFLDEPTRSVSIESCRDENVDEGSSQPRDQPHKPLHMV